MWGKRQTAARPSMGRAGWGFPGNKVQLATGERATAVSCSRNMPRSNTVLPWTGWGGGQRRPKSRWSAETASIHRPNPRLLPHVGVRPVMTSAGLVQRSPTELARSRFPLLSPHSFFFLPFSLPPIYTQLIFSSHPLHHVVYGRGRVLHSGQPAEPVYKACSRRPESAA